MHEPSAHRNVAAAQSSTHTEVTVMTHLHCAVMCTATVRQWVPAASYTDR